MATIRMIREWNVEAIRGVFDVSTARANGFVLLRDGLDSTELALQEWEGRGGDAFREEMNSLRVSIDAQSAQAQAVAVAANDAATQVQACKTKLEELERQAAAANLRINDDGSVTTIQSGRLLPGQWAAMQELKPQVAQLLLDADAADLSLANSLHAAVGDYGSIERPGVSDVHDADLPGDTNWLPNPDGTAFDPEAWQNSWQNPHMVDNPPGYTGDAGPARDAAWDEYLHGLSAPVDTNGDGFVDYRDSNSQIYLPNPNAVTNPRLQSLGHAGTQAGTSYAWAGGRGTGPDPGDYLYDDGVIDTSDNSYIFQDPDRIGFDCSGLTEYSTAMAGVTGPVARNDESGLLEPQTIGTYTGHQLESSLLTPVNAGEALAPGDLVYYGDGSAYHVGIYVTDGVIMNAPGSGEPVQLDARTTTIGGEGFNQVRVLRIPG